MKITRITCWAVPIPLTDPYFLRGGRLKVTSIDSTLIRIDTDEGVSGWGEACPWGSRYLPAHGPGVRAGLETVAPDLIGENPLGLEHINRVMDAALPGHPYVKSGLDIACWDILGKVSGLPLWQLFGGDGPDAVEMTGSVSAGDPDDMVARMKICSARGVRAHSIKLGDLNPALDIERIRAVDAALPAGECITWDANRGWTPGVAMQVLNATQTTHWVEQPCDGISECALVAGRVANPIMLDECLFTFDDHLRAWSLGAAQGVKVKPGRAGGLTRARQIRDFGVSVGWQMHIEGLGGCGLEDMAVLHLASSTPTANRLSSWSVEDLVDIDICNGTAPRNQNGFLSPHSTPGHGTTPDLDALGDPAAIYEMEAA
ncbi:mandelate racemase/muconate lactonizing enzyme family protein [uncultured Tateyamaria sp.]|uniref:mandelate racemase/muconate lactonizing enzyme family protein n=1 Tax=uncultured Tateyamaria sp. TaxID=455651 RepID=UPI002614680D|nr:mandelate racemase/muconate lactonizing enzyme family protein [uncultured Tateyamaria sp.]